ncbi:conjugal transfer protein TraG N-terminal domain-containing protein [Endozoicomonas gorgoniicola]|uniref:Conjugal transfer protein TraG N-terminal domain-containing protein n=1 Tax=Endozoicomonas gorgoniicola TaxID=1234144 RepID=A0ABT3MTY2_9GAMM|nr:conjugal transfer protein TraG N-terminal domain-containing protein [Endozoicomonas gorgoniicola]MCW7552829.1 conjugal transfer protein TraG N-terminal domain-containing protein [Endozoicomonas gorgoniicola]
METVYSIGDANFLYTILNGLVMMVGNPEFIMTIKIGFTIGAFYLALQGLIAGKFPAFQHLLLSLLIYSALFGLPAGGKTYKGIDVDIYDVYTDTNRKVDDVPFGIALTASMLSSLTWKLTETFEQTFHTTDATRLTRSGYMSSLVRMMEARSFAMERFHTNRHLAQSWLNYIKECTLIGLDQSRKAIEDVFDNPNILSGLEYPSEVFGTLIFKTAQSQGENVTCNQAFLWLRQQTQLFFDQQLQTELSSQRGISLGESLRALSEHAESSRNFLMASALLPIYHDATVERLQQMQQPQAAIMTQQALLQRNSQWAGEQHLFLSSMRAMMAYIEGFVFAVTPLMGLLVCVGLFGVRLAFKYLMLLLWIQLWMPVLAINNLYISMVAKGAMANMSAPITSFSGIMEAGPILEYWLGVGGMMAASTPALVLMLLYGSAITATHLAGRMQSGDFVNEKIPTPDVLMPGSAINQQAGWNIAPQQGATRGQIDQVVPALSASSQLSSLVQSKDAARKSAGLAFSQATTNAFHQRFGESVDAKEMQQFSDSLSSSQGQVAQVVNDMARDIKKNFGLSSQQSRDIAVSKTLNTGAGLGHSIVGAFTGVKADYGRTEKGANTDTQQSNFREAMEHVSKEGFSKAWDSRINKAMAMDASNSHSESWVKELGVSDNQQYQKSAQESLSTEKSYEEASQLQHQLGQALSTAPAVWANKLASSDAAMSTLQNVPYDSDFNQSVNSNIKRFQGQFANSKEALAAALVASHINTPTQQNFERLGKALGQAGLSETSKQTATPLANQELKENELPKVSENVSGRLTTPKAIDKHDVEQNISGSRLQTDRAKSLTGSYLSGSQSLSGRFERSDQNKSQVTGLLTQSSFGRNPSTEGKGLSMTSSEAFDKAIEYGLTQTQASLFSSLVKDRDPSYERSTEPEERSHRSGQAIAEISRGWGESGATLGLHAFNHLTHAADHPEHTHSALSLIGEMNRVYQPELKAYDQSVSSLLKGQELYAQEGNYLDTSMPPEHIGSGVKEQLQAREKENNQWLFGSDIGRFHESSGKITRAVRETKNDLSNLIKPD